ncbi:SDR family oxidoreductase [Geminocystis sp. GBBB08]|uniref:SDR family oxidoreductase n=1 Tax=Geminocystis sp. GBBB08 TaxID=2604140 RepID=UPI0027E2F834|nr:SDR family oxidoreductase [Geminocystis sp. GBBB08]MBL1208538.1 SDR family oxidoreductase [Geminocystis sp. GBBB08]
MMTKKVLITGATGRTGSLVVKKLQLDDHNWQVIPFAKSKKKAQEIFTSTEGFIFGNILSSKDLAIATQGCNGLIILTSAVPKMIAPPQEGKPPEFDFEENGKPEEVDWLGQKNQIDAAKNAGIEHIILVGSMGGTNENHPLNRLGNGNILIWKRKAEQYLIDSGIDYTIIRAGGLLDKPEGRRELLVGKDDKFLTSPPNGIPTSIPRGDVANVVIQALNNPFARNKAFDLISQPENEINTSVTIDWDKFFQETTAGL